MQPKDLRAESFSRYPPQAASLAKRHISAFQQLPLSLFPIILLQVIDYDWRFPVEQRNLRRQLEYLSSLSSAQLANLTEPFSAVRLDPSLAKIDWVNEPERYNEQFGAMLWSSLQMDIYRKSVLAYEETIARALPEEPPELSRFAIVVVGKGAEGTGLELFRSLRPHGLLFNSVNPSGGLQTLLSFVSARAKRRLEPYAHWYIDGGQAESNCGAVQGVSETSFARVAPAAVQELRLTNKFIQHSPTTVSMGPEAVRSYMASLRPEDLGLSGGPADAALRHFEASLLTGGAGTQVFSTTFVQWAARESLRRAQPLTLLARFAPRQQMAPMNTLLARDPFKQATDPEGSLIDADVGAYYTWINLRRLSGADKSHFLAWFEGHNLALAISPTFPRGQVSLQPVSIADILSRMT